MDNLPNILPVLRLGSTILMPQANLPVYMTINCYREMSSELIEDNIVAIVQPIPSYKNSPNNSSPNTTNSFKTGCAGRIKEISFSEDEVTILISGICRFEIVSELQLDKSGFRRVKVSYDKYRIDLEKQQWDSIDKQKLFSALNSYFKYMDISPNWEEIEKTSADVLISAIAMACPFHPSEKQSVLETVGIKEQSDMITKIIEMNSFERFHSSNQLN